MWRISGLLPVLLACALVGCGEDNSDSATSPGGDTAAGDIGDIGGIGGHDGAATNDDAAANDDAVTAFTPDATDKAIVAALDKVHEGLAKTPLWAGFPLPNAPLYLARRSIKGTPRHGLLLHIAKLPKDPNAVQIGGHLVHPDDTGLKVLGTTLATVPYAKHGSHMTTFAAYSDLDVDRLADWVGEVAAASFTRMREVEATWAAVEGCGLAKYPRNKELISLTLLEEALLGEIVLAPAADLPARATELVAVRAARLALDPYVARIDSDGENRFGTPEFARTWLPVLAGLRTDKDARDKLVAAKKLAMTTPLDELDNHLMWVRPPITAAITIDMARRLGWDVRKTFEAGEATHAVAILKHAVNPALVDTVKARHDMKAISKRATDLMAR